MTFEFHSNHSWLAVNANTHFWSWQITGILLMGTDLYSVAKDGQIIVRVHM